MIREAQCLPLPISAPIFFKKYFDLHPTEAIYYGIEGYDHLLNDYSDEVPEQRSCLHEARTTSRLYSVIA